MLKPNAIVTEAVYALTSLERSLTQALMLTKRLTSWKRKIDEPKQALLDSLDAHNTAVAAVHDLETEHPEMAFDCIHLLEQAKAILQLNKERLHSFVDTCRIPNALTAMQELYLKEVGQAYVEPDEANVSVVAEL
jgi:hypothetical protein